MFELTIVPDLCTERPLVLLSELAMRRAYELMWIAFRLLRRLAAVQASLERLYRWELEKMSDRDCNNTAEGRLRAMPACDESRNSCQSCVRISVGNESGGEPGGSFRGALADKGDNGGHGNGD